MRNLSVSKYKFKTYRYGNGLAMLFDRKGNPWITIGPDFGFTLCLFVFVAALYSLFLYFLFHINNIPSILLYLGVGLVLVNASATLITVFLNPGHPEKGILKQKNHEW